VTECGNPSIVFFWKKMQSSDYWVSISWKSASVRLMDYYFELIFNRS
jgi:hypothetical protein